jgi:hypothetical protein
MADVSSAMAQCTAAYSPQNPIHEGLRELRVLVDCANLKMTQGHGVERPASVPTFLSFVGSDCIEPLHRAAAHMRSAAKAKAELNAAVAAHEADQQALQGKTDKYATKGKSLTESSKFTEFRESEVRSRAEVQSAQAAFGQQLNAALRAKEVSLCTSLRGVGEHFAGVLGILSDGFRRVFDASPLAPIKRASSPMSPVRTTTVPTVSTGTPLSPPQIRTPTYASMRSVQSPSAAATPQRAPSFLSRSSVEAPGGAATRSAPLYQ